MIWRKKRIRQNNLFVSIGGGINQIPLIEEAKKLKLQVIGVDKNITAAGIHLCDIKIQESIDNYTEIYIKLKELLSDGEITGVLSKSFGPALKTTSYISAKMNIPLFPFNRVDDFINKDKMKKVLKKHRINSPGYTLLNPKNRKQKEIKLQYPFIIKPVTGHAKSGVEFINDSNELGKYLKSVSDNDSDYLVENFIKGDEVIAIGIVHKGKFYLVELTDKVKSPLPYFVDIMHISPSRYFNIWDKIQETGQKIADSFEIITSPLLMELIINDKGDIFVIEAAPEFGGEFLSDVLIPQRTGYNIIRESINAVTNRNFKPPVNKKSRNSVIVKYITGNRGNLLSFNPLYHKYPGIIFSKVFKDIGSAIKKPANNHDRIGVLIARGRTTEETMETIQNAENSMNIRIGDKAPGKK